MSQALPTSLGRRRTSSTVLSSVDLNQSRREGGTNLPKLSDWSLPIYGGGENSKNNLPSSGNLAGPFLEKSNFNRGFGGSGGTSNLPEIRVDGMYDRSMMSSPEIKAGNQFRNQQEFRTRNPIRNESISLAYKNSRYAGNSFSKRFKSISPSDFILFISFLLCVYAFLGALSGRGYTDPSIASTESSIQRNWPKISEMDDDISSNINVEIPASFLSSIPVDSEPSNDNKPSEYLADVHARVGDDSHDFGNDMMRDSPTDHTIDDEHVHHIHPNPISILDLESHSSDSEKEVHDHHLPIDVVLSTEEDQVDSFLAEYEEEDLNLVSKEEKERIQKQRERWINNVEQGREEV